MKSPVREIQTKVMDSGTTYTNRIFVGTATTGLVRTEWASARYSATVPMNWSQVMYYQYMSGAMPLNYFVDDAQNLIVRECLKGDYEWLFLLEHDVIVPDTILIKLNQYMRDARYPVVSGLYYSRGRPSEPLVFRGRGTGAFVDFKMGDLVWCDGVPTGCLLVHHSILKLMWGESEEYVTNTPSQERTRRVFQTPQTIEHDGQMHNTVSGTSDLNWCSRIMNEDVFKRAGWDGFAPDMKWPFLVDTNIFCRHINMNGEQFP